MRKVCCIIENPLKPVWKLGGCVSTKLKCKRAPSFNKFCALINPNKVHIFDINCASTYFLMCSNLTEKNSFGMCPYVIA